MWAQVLRACFPLLSGAVAKSLTFVLLEHMVLFKWEEPWEAQRCVMVQIWVDWCVSH